MRERVQMAIAVCATLVLMGCHHEQTVANPGPSPAAVATATATATPPAPVQVNLLYDGQSGKCKVTPYQQPVAVGQAVTFNPVYSHLGSVAVVCDVTAKSTPGNKHIFGTGKDHFKSGETTPPASGAMDDTWSYTETCLTSDGDRCTFDPEICIQGGGGTCKVMQDGDPGEQHEHHEHVAAPKAAQSPH